MPTPERYHPSRINRLRATGILTLAAITLLLPQNFIDASDRPISNQTQEFTFYGAPNSFGILGENGGDTIDTFYSLCNTYPQEILPFQAYSCSADLITFSGSGFNLAVGPIASELLNTGHDIYIHFHPPGDWSYDQINQAITNIFSGQPVFPDDPNSIVLSPQLLSLYADHIGFSYDPETKYFWYGQQPTDITPVNVFYQKYLDAISVFTNSPLGMRLYDLGGGSYYTNPQILTPGITPIAADFFYAGTPIDNAKWKAFMIGRLAQRYHRDVGCMFFLWSQLPTKGRDNFPPSLAKKTATGGFSGQQINNNPIDSTKCIFILEQ